MAMNYTVHNDSLSRSSLSKAQVPLLIAPLVGERLALGTASAAIPGPCEIRVMPDEDIWFDIRPSVGALSPETSPLKLLAGTENWFELQTGTHYIEGSAA